MASRLNGRIATTEAGLAKGAFFVRGLPPPEFFYADHSVRSSQGEGGESLDGYKSVRVIWTEGLTAAQAGVLRSLVEAAQATAAGTLFLTVLRTDAANAGWGDWIDVSGYPSMPEWGPVRNGVLYRPVELVVNNLTILNDPSTYN